MGLLPTHDGDDRFNTGGLPIGLEQGKDWTPSRGVGREIPSKEKLIPALRDRTLWGVAFLAEALYDSWIYRDPAEVHYNRLIGGIALCEKSGVVGKRTYWMETITNANVGTQLLDHLPRGRRRFFY